MHNRGFDKLQQQFNENPLQTLLVGSMAMTALAKLLSSVSEARRNRTWDREVARRERMEYRRPSKSRR